MLVCNPEQELISNNTTNQYYISNNKLEGRMNKVGAIQCCCCFVAVRRVLLLLSGECCFWCRRLLCCECCKKGEEINRRNNKFYELYVHLFVKKIKTVAFEYFINKYYSRQTN